MLKMDGQWMGNGGYIDKMVKYNILAHNTAISGPIWAILDLL